MSTHENFESRHIGPSLEQEATMLHELGFAEKEESYVGDCGELHVVIDI